MLKDQDRLEALALKLAHEPLPESLVLEYLTLAHLRGLGRSRAGVPSRIRGSKGVTIQLARSAASHLSAADRDKAAAGYVRYASALSGQMSAEPHRLKSYLVTAGATAYHAGRWQGFRETWDDLWGFEIVTMRDARVRPAHMRMDRYTAQKESPVWRVWWAPFGWRCRCTNREIYKGTGARASRRKGLPPAPDEGFRFNAGILLERNEL
jgi:SPP1 gp7 family putative phage head morphogenesis protein